jgi:hypothetical protein
MVIGDWTATAEQAPQVGLLAMRLEVSRFGSVSDFDIRISDFLRDLWQL